MRVSSRLLLILSVLAAMTGCKRDEAAPAPSTPEPQAAAPAKARVCEGEGEGTFSSPCIVTGKSPLRAKWTGRWKKDPFGKELPEFEVTNELDQPIDWATVSYWYYGKDGKLLKGTRLDGSEYAATGYYSGASELIGPKETKTVLIGMATRLPNVRAVEAEYTSWGHEKADPKRYFQLDSRNRGRAEERPLGGWN